MCENMFKHGEREGRRAILRKGRGRGSSREGGNHIQGEVWWEDDVAGPLGREAGNLPSIDSKSKISSSEPGKAILSELRKGMELERKRVIRYLENQKESRWMDGGGWCGGASGSVQYCWRAASGVTKVIKRFNN